MLFVQCIVEIAWFCFEACRTIMTKGVTLYFCRSRHLSIKQDQTFACIGVVMHQDGTGNFKDICLMIWNEVMLGITSASHNPMNCCLGLKSCSLEGIILHGLLSLLCFSFPCLRSFTFQRKLVYLVLEASDQLTTLRPLICSTSCFH